MDYKEGLMGPSDMAGIVFMMILPRIFLSSLSQVTGTLEEAAWMGIMLHGIISYALSYSLILIVWKYKGDIYTVAQKLLGSFFARVLALFWILAFWGNATSLMRQYAENTITTSMPELEFQMAIFWYLLFTIIICYYGIEVIGRVSSFLLPVTLLALVIIMVMVMPFLKVYRFFPWQGSGLETLLAHGFTGIGYNFGAITVVIFSLNMQNASSTKKALNFGLGTAVGVKIIYTIVYLFAFGVAIGSEKNMPFFEITRLVYLNRYIQRIEALFIIFWVFLGLLCISISLYTAAYLIGRVFKLPSLKPIIPVMAILSADIASMPNNIGEVIYWDIVTVRVMTTAFYSSFLLLVLAAFIKRKDKSTCASR